MLALCLCPVTASSVAAHVGCHVFRANANQAHHTAQCLYTHHHQSDHHHMYVLKNMLLSYKIALHPHWVCR